MKSPVLAVRHYDRQVGTITRSTSGALRFEYATSWIDAATSFALASNLPLRAGATETTYFENLLPEAGARERIAKVVGISPDNDFEFLRIFGADCAGSLEIIDPNHPIDAATEDAFLLLTEDDGARLATKTGFASFFHPEIGVRLSLAGAHNKLAVVKTNEGLALPLGGRPSTHILKLPNPDYKGLVENEAVVLAMAGALGLHVVKHDVVTLGTTNLLLVERYDRQVQGDKVLRLHQQDLCQATGLPPDIKYESEGGPSLGTVFDVIRSEVDDPLTATRSLLAWVAFNVLVHNADAHAKNISMLRTPGVGQQLAPFYDLVCTGAYDSLDHKMAMAVGGQFDPGAIARKHWTQLASAIDVGKSLVFRTVHEMAKLVPEVLDRELSTLHDRVGVPRRQQLERTIRRRVKKAVDLLA